MTDLIKSMLAAIEAELQKQVSRLDSPRTQTFHEMLAYHLGWTGEGAGPQASGKRIRPLLVLLTTAATSKNAGNPAGDSWAAALPAAAAVELIHNFSLVHDDIQDNSNLRHGRSTLWVKWGLPHAINAGDGLFVLANLAATDLLATYPAETVVKATQILQNACLDLTRGQFLDMSYEQRTDLGVEDYWPMTGGKTSALLSACCALGALLGNTDEATMDAYRSFGHYLGLAFQIQDDILGIWGNETVTGKSAASDLLEGKKSMPVLVGLGKKGQFAARWAQGPIQAEDVDEIARLLASEGGYAYADDMAKQMTDLAINSLREADPQGLAGDALMSLVDKLIKREA